MIRKSSLLIYSKLPCLAGRMLVDYHGILDIYETGMKLLIERDIEITKAKDNVFIFSCLHNYDIIFVI